MKIKFLNSYYQLILGYYRLFVNYFETIIDLQKDLFSWMNVSYINYLSSWVFHVFVHGSDIRLSFSKLPLIRIHIIWPTKLICETRRIILTWLRVPRNRFGLFVDNRLLQRKWNLSYSFELKVDTFRILIKEWYDINW